MESFYKKRLLINQIGKFIMYGLVIGNVLFVNLFLDERMINWKLFFCFLLLQIILFSLIDSFNNCIREYRNLLIELRFKKKHGIK